MVHSGVDLVKTISLSPAELRDGTEKIFTYSRVNSKQKSTTTVKIQIPKGSVHGDKLRLEGMGHEGAKSNGEPSDLILTLEDVSVAILKEYLYGNPGEDADSLGLKKGEYTIFYLPQKKGLFFWKKFYNWRICGNCKSEIRVEELRMTKRFLERRSDTKTITSSNSANFVSYNSRSGFSPVIGNIQSSQQVNQNYGKFSFTYYCPKCNFSEVQTREVEIDIFYDKNNKQRVEIKRGYHFVGAGDYTQERSLHIHNHAITVSKKLPN